MSDVDLTKLTYNEYYDGSKIVFRLPLKKYELKILANNKIYKANWVIVTNAMHYGGAFKLTGDTNIFNKKIITYLFCKLTRFNFLCYFFTLLVNKELKENNKLIKIVSDDIFISSKTKTPLQYDGEFLGYLPAQIKNSKKTIMFVKECHASND